MISVQIDDDVGEQIRRLAEQSRTTADRVVREAILQYAERSNAREAFLGEADASWDAFREDGLHLTGDEVSAWLRSLGTDDESEPPECHK